MRQIIVNLVGNAIKFTADGEIAVDLSLESRDGERGVIHGFVRDTGIGIPPDKLATVFEAFRQTDSSTTRKYGGTGLGLNISVQLVELMGGRMWVESEVGQGSEFHFTIPLDVGEEKDRDEEPAAAFSSTSALLISGNATARQAYAESLEALGLDVRSAETIEAALQTANPAGRRLVVIDVGAGRAIDLATIDPLKTSATSTEFVVLIPAGKVEQVERRRELGLTNCLVKPFKQEELVAALRGAAGITDNETRSDSTQKSAPVVGPLRILVADDSPFNQQVAAGLLGLHGHQVELANNGREAFEKYQQESFDLIFMDVEMPEVDGMAATRLIREAEQLTGKHIPIVGLSAHALVGFHEQCLAAGMDAYITKPIQTEELFGVLRLAAQSAEPAPTSPTADATPAAHA